MNNIVWWAHILVRIFWENKFYRGKLNDTQSKQNILVLLVFQLYSIYNYEVTLGDCTSLSCLRPNREGPSPHLNTVALSEFTNLSGKFCHFVNYVNSVSFGE